MRRFNARMVVLIVALMLGIAVSACDSDEGTDTADAVDVADAADADTTDLEDASSDVTPDGGEAEAVCTPDCEGKVCGDDGCGGSCGDCLGCEGEILGEEMCTDGVCPMFCCPDCTGRECGSDGCGGACGDCAALYAEEWICGFDGQCMTCDPDCAGKECGDDGCGGSCGSCPVGGSCIDGACPCLEDPGSAGRIRTIRLPVTPTEVGSGDDFGGATCFDLDGDDVPDNGIPQPIITLILPGPDPAEPFEDGTINLLLELKTCDASGSSYDLLGYDGIATETAGEYQIAAHSFGADGEPLVAFPTASLSEGALAAGPATITASYEGFAGLALPVNGMRVAATSASLVDDGLLIAGGSAGAYIFREDLAEALALAKVACAAEPPPFEACQYVGNVDMDTLDAVVDWDLDMPGCALVPDGADAEDCRAVSLCLFFATEPVIIAGVEGM